MSQKVGTLEAELLLEIAGFVRNAAKAEKRTVKMAKASAAAGRAIKVGAVAATAAFALLTAGVAKSVSLAADANETMNLLGATFGRNTKGVVEFANEVAASTGRSRFELQKMVSDVGAVTVGLTQNRKVGAEMAKGLVELAVDVASFRNLQDVDVLNKFKSAITGETEAIKSLGIVMTQSELANFALQQGLGNLKSLNAAQKATLRYEFILAKSIDAQGDAAKTAAALANQQRFLSAQVKDGATVIGQELIPIATDMITKLNEIIKSVIGDEKAFRSLVRKGINVAIDAFAFLVQMGFEAVVIFQRIKQAALIMKTGIVAAMFFALDSVDKFLEGVADLARKFPKLAKKMGIDADLLAQALDAPRDALEVMAEEGLKAFDAINDDIEKTRAIQDNFNTTLADQKFAWEQDAKAAADAAGVIGDDIPDAVGDADNAIKELAKSTAIRSFRRSITELLKEIQDARDPVSQTFEELQQNAAEAEAELPGVVAQLVAMNEAAKRLSKEGLAPTKQDFEDIKLKVEELLEVIQDADAAALAMAQASAENIRSLFDAIAGQITDAVTDAFFVAINEGQNAAEAINKIFESLGESILRTLIQKFFEAATAQIAAAIFGEQAQTTATAAGAAAREAIRAAETGAKIAGDAIAVGSHVAAETGQTAATVAGASTRIGASAAEGAAAAGKSGVASGLPFPLNIAAGLGAAALIFGSLIAFKSKFAKGGIVGGQGGIDNVPAMLTKGEMVIPVDATRQILKAARMPRVTAGPLPFAQGGVVGGTAGGGMGITQIFQTNVSTFGLASRATNDRWMRDVFEKNARRAARRRGAGPI